MPLGLTVYRADQVTVQCLLGGWERWGVVGRWDWSLGPPTSLRKEGFYSALEQGIKGTNQGQDRISPKG